MAGLLPPCDRILETVPALVSSTISPFTTSNVGDALEALEDRLGPGVLLGGIAGRCKKQTLYQTTTERRGRWEREQDAACLLSQSLCKRPPPIRGWRRIMQRSQPPLDATLQRRRESASFPPQPASASRQAGAMLQTSPKLDPFWEPNTATDADSRGQDAEEDCRRNGIQMQTTRRDSCRNGRQTYSHSEIKGKNLRLATILSNSIL